MTLYGRRRLRADEVIERRRLLAAAHEADPPSLWQTWTAVAAAA